MASTNATFALTVASAPEAVAGRAKTVAVMQADMMMRFLGMGARPTLHRLRGHVPEGLELKSVSDCHCLSSGVDDGGTSSEYTTAAGVPRDGGGRVSDVGFSCYSARASTPPASVTSHLVPSSSVPAPPEPWPRTGGALSRAAVDDVHTQPP
jgi:hypothetical protein